MSRKDRTKIEKIDFATQVRRRNKMSKEELLNYYQITKRSAHIEKDKSKFDKKKSRQERIEW